jgi:hypothetical protein|tara:strand:- start:81 stop:1313 length:1233 start_codon:yes stop_codon:yes gene_type:complete
MADKKFTDFAQSLTPATGDFVVGYSASSNEEIRVPMNAIPVSGVAGTVQGTDSNDHNIRSRDPNVSGGGLGSARGESSVDLQTLRAASNQVAAATNSSILGGENNSIIGGANHSVIAGGLTNSVATGAFYSFIGGGGSNSVNASSRNSVIVGGRSNATSRDYDFIGAGRNNKVTEEHSSVVGGERNQATSNHIFVGGGDNNTSSGPYTIIGGGNTNNITQTYSSIVGGYDNTVSSQYSAVGGGRENTASAHYSAIAGGYKGNADKFGQYAFGGGLKGGFGLGEAQFAKFVIANTTSNNTQTELFLDGSSATQRMTLNAGETWIFVATLAGRDGTDSCVFEIQGGIHRNGATTALIQTVTENFHKKTTGANTWDFTLEADDTNDALVAKVTGETSKTIKWVATVDVTCVKS